MTSMGQTFCAICSSRTKKKIFVPPDESSKIFNTCFDSLHSTLSSKYLKDVRLKSANRNQLPFCKSCFDSSLQLTQLSQQLSALQKELSDLTVAFSLAVLYRQTQAADFKNIKKESKATGSKSTKQMIQLDVTGLTQLFSINPLEQPNLKNNNVKLNYVQNIGTYVDESNNPRSPIDENEMDDYNQPTSCKVSKFNSFEGFENDDTDEEEHLIDNFAESDDNSDEHFEENDPFSNVNDEMNITPTARKKVRPVMEKVDIKIEVLESEESELLESMKTPNLQIEMLPRTTRSSQLHQSYKMSQSGISKSKRRRFDSDISSTSSRVKSSRVLNEVEDANSKALIKVPTKKAKKLTIRPYKLSVLIENHFTYKGHVGGSNIIVLTCTHCNKDLRGRQGGVSNFTRHLKLQHKEIEPTSLSIKFVNKTPFEAAKKPVTEKIRKSSKLQQKFNDAVLDLIAIDGLPINVTEGFAFKKLISLLRPEINVFSRTTVTRHLDEVVNQSIIPELNELILSVPDKCMHLSMDLWSSQTLQSVMGVKMQFIDENWELVAKTIGFSCFVGNHTGTQILSKFEDLLKNRGILSSQIGKVMADNASNMTNAFNMVEIFSDKWNVSVNCDEITDCSSSEYDEDDFCDIEDVSEDIDEATKLWERLGCLAHQIQLAINSSIQDDDTSKDFIAVISRLTNMFKRCNIWREKLEATCGKELVQPGKTRWNSVINAIEKLSTEEVFNNVTDLVKQHDVKARDKVKKIDLPMSFNLENIREIRSILKPLAVATDRLRKNGTTSPVVLLVLTTAYSAVEKIKPRFFGDLKSNLLNQLKERFREAVHNPAYIISALLHPRLKLRIFRTNLSGLQMIPADEAQKMLEDLFSDPEPEIDMEDEQQDPHNLFELLDKFAPDDNGNKLLEVREYFGEPCAEIENPLSYWRENMLRFPKLASLARQFLGIPSTTGDGERLFSVAVSFQRAKRSRITNERLEKLLLLRESRLP